MKDSGKLSGRKVAGLFTLSLFAGITGMLFARHFGATLQTSPAWLGPAIVIGVLTVFISGILLLPTLVRAIQAAKRGPAA